MLSSGQTGTPSMRQPPMTAWVPAMAAPAENPAYGHTLADAARGCGRMPAASDAWYSGVGPPPTKRPSTAVEALEHRRVERRALGHPHDLEVVATDELERVEVALVVVERLLVGAHHDEQDAAGSGCGRGGAAAAAAMKPP